MTGGERRPDEGLEILCEAMPYQLGVQRLEVPGDVAEGHDDQRLVPELAHPPSEDPEAVHTVTEIFEILGRQKDEGWTQDPHFGCEFVEVAAVRFEPIVTIESPGDVVMPEPHAPRFWIQRSVREQLRAGTRQSALE